MSAITKIVVMALVGLTFSIAVPAQNWPTAPNYQQPQSQAGYYQVYQAPPRRTRRLAKFLRVTGVALPYASQLTTNPKALRAITMASMAIAVSCELKNCNDPYGSYSGQDEGYYPVGENYPVEEVYEDYGQPQNSASYAFASYTGSNVSTRDPLARLKGIVNSVVGRIRQMGGVVKRIRFRHTGTTWECGIEFRMRGKSDGFCLVKANGTVEWR